MFVKVVVVKLKQLFLKLPCPQISRRAYLACLIIPVLSIAQKQTLLLFQGQPVQDLGECLISPIIDTPWFSALTFELSALFGLFSCLPYARISPLMQDTDYHNIFACIDKIHWNFPYTTFFSTYWPSANLCKILTMNVWYRIPSDIAIFWIVERSRPAIRIFILLSFLKVSDAYLLCFSISSFAFGIGFIFPESNASKISCSSSSNW